MAMTCEEFYQQLILGGKPTDEDLREFFELLWNTHNRFMFAVAFALVHNEHDARDVVGNAVLNVMKHVQKHRDTSKTLNFKGLMRVVVRREAWRLMKLRQRDAQPIAKDEADPASESPDLDREPDESEMIRFLRECIEKLADKARKLIRLCDMEGRKVKDVAAEWGMTPDAFYVALHRARKFLRECVAASALREGVMP